MPRENTSPNTVLVQLHLGQAAGQRQLAELEQAGLGLTRAEIQHLGQARQEALAKTGRLEFGQPAIVQIARAFSASSFLFEENCAETLESVQETFYLLRSDVPSNIPDEELIEGMFLAFEGSCGGDCDALAALSATEVLGQLAVHDDREPADDEPYSITDDEGRVYSWNPDSWEDNILAPGWSGERWGDDWD
ncbi:MAG: DUF6323 family protein [Eggerthellaceae bacterium]